ncbi:pirin family protein [Thalassolituus hydrocarboniclasticus]|uniref:Pirin family protein n=1 Tax=Thalassolituus hydrocarboniclasticus TaxID=2742796 RepID=A0ABY6ACE5_9GAMM|nr:pirin family protein [Thalassolituus hydrocarboniclasticus]UXD88457.1 pirin family protein [Thalassolituus hydrocarboniclasticus]
MALELLAEEQVEISGFGGIRERVLVMDPRQFGHHVREECWPGFGACVYLANAWFLPGGSTGLHSHEQIDIVSVMTRGELHHQGSIGDGEVLQAGQVQLQRSGIKGFRHNEQNPGADYPAMVQIWLVPQSHEGEAGYQVIELNPSGLTCVYGGELFAASTRVDVLQLAAGDEWALEDDALGYVFRGAAISADGQRLQRGDLFRLSGQSLSLMAESGFALVMIREA